MKWDIYTNTRVKHDPCTGLNSGLRFILCDFLSGMCDPDGWPDISPGAKWWEHPDTPCPAPFRATPLLPSCLQLIAKLTRAWILNLGILWWDGKSTLVSSHSLLLHWNQFFWWNKWSASSNFSRIIAFRRNHCLREKTMIFILSEWIKVTMTVVFPDKDHWCCSPQASAILETFCAAALASVPCLALVGGGRWQGCSWGRAWVSGHHTHLDEGGLKLLGLGRQGFG